MGELNPDKFERAWILASEQQPQHVMSSIEKKRKIYLVIVGSAGRQRFGQRNDKVIRVCY